MLRFPSGGKNGGRQEICHVDAECLVNAGEDSGKPRLVDVTEQKGAQFFDTPLTDR